MASFQIKYRQHDGSLAEDVVEADSRSSAFNGLKSRGITPISVTEGKKHKHAKNPIATSSKVFLKHFVFTIFVIVFVFSACLIWNHLSRSQTNDTESFVAAKMFQTNEVICSTVSKPTHIITNLPQRVNASQSVETIADFGEWHGQKIVDRNVRTNNAGTVIQILKTADGKTHRITTPAKPIFDNASDQLIAMAISGAEFDLMAPMPLSASIESDFKKSLEKPIVIEETDPEEIKQMKLAVLEVREELKKVVADGGSVQDALAQHQQLVNANGKLRLEAQKEISHYMSKGDIEGARNYVKTINQALSQMGVKEITMPTIKDNEKKREFRHKNQKINLQTLNEREEK